MMIPNLETLPLTSLPRELTALTGKQAPSYRKLWSLTVDGRLPAEQVNGRYQVRRADLPSIAAVLGLTVPVAPRASRASKREAASVTA